MQALLDRIGIARAEVATTCTTRTAARCLRLGGAAPGGHHRALAKRLRDNEFAAAVDAIENLSLIEAANAEEEALAIAVAMREAGDPDKTVALVTPDRALARRVVAALARWDVKVDEFRR